MTRGQSIVFGWFCTVCLMCRGASLHAENWPRFRGPTGQGVSGETGLPTQWNANENVAWRTELPGEGWSSPVVWDDQVFVTATTEDGRSCHVISLDRRTGDLLWNKRVFEQEPRHKRQDNSYATPTPTTDGEQVYAVFSSGGIVALDMQGTIRWTNHEVSFYSQHGLGASPILCGDLLIMPFDGSSAEEGSQLGFKDGWDGAVILALDKRSGQVHWRGQRGLSRLAHVTPNILQRDGNSELISAAGDVIQGHDPATGKLLWTVHSQGEGVAPSVVLAEDLAYTCSGFEAPTIRAVRAGGEGDVTATHIVWEQKQGVPMLASLLYAEPYLYSVTDTGILNCFDAQTGKPVWRKRIGTKYSASPVCADGKIYLLSELEGETLVIRPGDHYEEIARNPLDEVCKASLAVSQGNLFIRTASHLYCIGTKP